MAETIRIIGIMPVGGELLRRRIKTVKTILSSADPENSLRIFEHGLDSVGISGLISLVRFKDRVAMAVISDQTIIRAKPHKPFAILKDGSDGRMKKASKWEAFETEVLVLGEKPGGRQEGGQHKQHYARQEKRCPKC